MTAVGVLMVGMLIWTGGIGSATPPAIKVMPGSQWSLTFNGGPCEVQSFSAKGTWTADKNEDAGTYAVRGKSLDEQWTSGDQVGLTFGATYVKADGAYQGTFRGFQSGTGKLTKGAKSRC
jgi:hypothetical protein